MKILFPLLILSIPILSCTTQTKFTSFPKKIGYENGETLIVYPTKDLTELKSQDLLVWANKYLKENTAVKTITYWDADFQFKAKGLMMPKSATDTLNLMRLKENPIVDFILFSTLVQVDENYENELGNPNYQSREAIMRFLLYDIRTQKLSWQCTSSIRLNPVKVKGRTQQYSINMATGNLAVAKVFKKSIKRLVSALSLNPTKKNSVKS